MAEDPREWSPYAFLAIKVNAGYDRNGNPRRGWIIVNTRTGEEIDFVDEGYQGDRMLKKTYPNIVKGPEIPTTPITYRQLIRFGREQAEKHRRDPGLWF